MRVFVKNADGLVPLKVKRSASVAALKVAYLASGKAVGRRSCITFSFEGHVLDDFHALKQYGVQQDSIVHHLVNARASFAPVNYQSIASFVEQEQRQRRQGAQDPDDFPEDWDPSWDKGDEWMSYPPVFMENIWGEDDGKAEGAAEGAASGAAAGGSGAAGTDAHPGRVLGVAIHSSKSLISRTAANHRIPIRPGRSVERRYKSMYVTQIGASTFTVLHRMEGRWNGEFEAVAARGTAPGARVVSTEFGFDTRAGIWRERQTLTSSEGLSTVTNLAYFPVADGTALVETDDPEFKQLQIKLVEQSQDIVLVTALSVLTGKPAWVETITLVDDFRRVRSVQKFSAEGNFEAMILFKEQRVIDAVTGAVMPAVPV